MPLIVPLIVSLIAPLTVMPLTMPLIVSTQPGPKVDVGPLPHAGGQAAQQAARQGGARDARLALHQGMRVNMFSTFVVYFVYPSTYSSLYLG